jgi:hypothetical protein
MSDSHQSTILWTLAFLVALAVPAAAQETTEGRLDITAPGDVPDWDGESISRVVSVRLCWQGDTDGSESFIPVRVAVEAPEWVTVSAPGEIWLHVPADAAADGCTDPQRVPVGLSAADDLPENERFDVEVRLTPRADDQASDPENATILANEGSASFQVRTSSATGVQSDAEETPPPQNEDEREERRNWWPFLALILLLAAVVITIAVLVTTRRRNAP